MKWRRWSGWQFWICPLSSGVVFAMLGGELRSKAFVAVMTAFFLGRLDAWLERRTDALEASETSAEGHQK